MNGKDVAAASVGTFAARGDVVIRGDRIEPGDRVVDCTGATVMRAWSNRTRT